MRPDRGWSEPAHRQHLGQIALPAGDGHVALHPDRQSGILHSKRGTGLRGDVCSLASGRHRGGGRTDSSSFVLDKLMEGYRAG